MRSSSATYPGRASIPMITAPTAAPTAQPTWLIERSVAGVAARSSSRSVRASTSALRAPPPLRAASATQATATKAAGPPTARYDSDATACTTSRAPYTSRAPSRSAIRPTGVAASTPTTPAAVIPSPTCAGDSPTERVRNSAQLVYHAPFPIAEISVPAAIRRSGPAGTMTIHGTLNDRFHAS